MSYLQTEIISHTRRVCSLYKRAARCYRDWAPSMAAYRIQVTLLRNEFDQNRNLVDGQVVQKLLAEGEKMVQEKQHYMPKKFAYSPGGIAYQRTMVTPDWVLDYWSPEEKAEYPEYFARREQRKKEYTAYYEKKFGVKAEEPAHHH